MPRYNVAPRTHAPVIRRAQPGVPALIMHSMRWGLVPHWSKAEPPTLNTINARAENLEESSGGMWGSLKGRKRCVVVAQGYVQGDRREHLRFTHLADTTNGSRKAHSVFHTLRDIKIGGSCYLPAYMTRRPLMVCCVGVAFAERQALMRRDRCSRPIGAPLDVHDRYYRG